jgi:hypothetical protein
MKTLNFDRTKYSPTAELDAEEALRAEQETDYGSWTDDVFSDMYTAELVEMYSKQRNRQRAKRARKEHA